LHNLEATPLFHSAPARGKPPRHEPPAAEEDEAKGHEWNQQRGKKPCHWPEKQFDFNASKIQPPLATAQVFEFADRYDMRRRFDSQNPNALMMPIRTVLLRFVPFTGGCALLDL